MAINYVSLAATAKRLIAENGKNVVFTRVVPETPVDTAKPWRKGTPNSFTLTVRAVEYPYTVTEVDDKVIKRGDTRVYVAADAVEIAAATQDIAATNLLTLIGQPTDGQTVTINGKVYTFQTALTNTDGHILIGIDAETSLDNLVAAINLASGAGTSYATLTTVHTTVSAVDGSGTTVALIAKTAGEGGNALTLATNITGATVTAAMFAGGVSVSRDLEDYNFCTFSDERWEIGKVNKIRPADVVVLFDINMRR